MGSPCPMHAATSVYLGIWAVRAITLRDTGVKLEKLGDDYDPLEDTCIKAFVRLLALVAAAAITEADA